MTQVTGLGLAAPSAPQWLNQPVLQPPAQNSVTAVKPAGESRSDGTALAGREDRGAAISQLRAARESARLLPPDPNRPTGPPPTFSTTALELGSDLQVLLARMNAAGYRQADILRNEGSGTTGPRPAGNPPGVAADVYAAMPRPDSANAGRAGPSRGIAGPPDATDRREPFANGAPAAAFARGPATAIVPAAAPAASGEMTAAGTMRPA